MDSSDEPGASLSPFLSEDGANCKEVFVEDSAFNDDPFSQSVTQDQPLVRLLNAFSY